MARGSGALMARASAMAVLALVLGTLGAVAWRAGGLGALDATDLAAARFTVAQALVSATLSVAFAVPVARALYRRRFRGRGALIALMGAPFILPAVVAVMGLLAVFGRAGVLSDALAALGLPRISIYGAQGVVLAHVFFNLPLATRLLLHGWQAIPSERFRLAASLGFTPAHTRRHIEAPMLRATLPGAWLAIFLVCLTSFAVALTLGGGPAATTIELAIYQAFRFDFDLGRAASLGLLQVALCTAALMATARIALPQGFGAGLDRAAVLPAHPGRLLKAQDGAAIALAAGFLIVPMAAVLGRGLPALASLPASVWLAAGRSLGVALAATVLTLALALPLALAAAKARHRGFEWAGTLPLVASPLVLGTGLFLLLRPFAAPASLALPVTVLVNAALALPFALRSLLPAARNLHADYDRLATSLSLGGLARLRLLSLPRLARPLGFAAGLSAALSMGDLGVIALFADPAKATLPLQLYALMGAYRMADAAAAASLLMVLSFALFWLFDRAGQHADT
ncbi:thiamine/thiamine pyrophosphate ABC transporter permease ThiP [Phaeovulum sp.]|uniref:thiamine/thiamine pyrophosphate ABC transporter permease ThiP n=1 Tax=Phaeovulum sp. TaxID=2934796 RepID=UPI002731D149|nr:thiamine/thiamine pyrophosphate ABC transporter permease ThiP [Phaeovulum sp.]MDP1669062.1 thiamine/thiamine pyrophosphate ABC transporter permease ThiP [Phaeovulum sp.]MDZ4117701.1 thiamine/thiamine pyrophosphate ABC transporter permease ThiP [Phaeovulum sp.]